MGHKVSGCVHGAVEQVTFLGECQRLSLLQTPFGRAFGSQQVGLMSQLGNVWSGKFAAWLLLFSAWVPRGAVAPHTTSRQHLDILGK